MTIDTKALYLEVAADALTSMNQAMREYRDANPDEKDWDGYDSEVYLYVFADGSWSIEHAQFIQTTNGTISAVPLSFYESIAQLAEDIEANEDWDAIEDAEEE